MFLFWDLGGLALGRWGLADRFQDLWCHWVWSYVYVGSRNLSIHRLTSVSQDVLGFRA